MKKITIVSLASFLFLLLCSIVACATKHMLVNQVTTLILGLVILALSGVIVIFAKEIVWLNSLCFLISSVAMGVLIRAWYINRGFDNSLITMALVSLSAVLYLWVFFALSGIPLFRRSRKAYIIFTVTFAALSGIGYLIVMLNTKTTYVSTFGYYMILELAFIFAMSLEVESKRQLLRNLTLSTYSVFAVAIGVAVAVVLALACGDGGGDCDCDCGGECCECADACGGCDCDLGSGNSGGKKKKE